MVAYKEPSSVHAQRLRAYGQLVWSLLTVVVCVGSLGILVCGGDDHGEHTKQLTTNPLTGGQEIPPVSSIATGSATLTINEAQSQINFTLIVSTAPPTAIREAHIHIAPPGVNGPIVLDFCTTNL